MKSTVDERQQQAFWSHVATFSGAGTALENQLRKILTEDEMSKGIAEIGQAEQELQALDREVRTTQDVHQRKMGGNTSK